jgi:hypothetical protein
MIRSPKMLEAWIGCPVRIPRKYDCCEGVRDPQRLSSQIDWASDTKGFPLATGPGAG